jgi:hypothetical protein
MKKALLLCAFLLPACSSAPPPGTPVTFQTIENQAHHDQQLEIEGYLRLPRMGLVTDTMLIELHPSADEKDATKVLVSMPVGTGSNQMEKPPKDYKREDLKVHTADGTVVGPDDKVRVSGKYYYNKTSATQVTTFLAKPVSVTKL